MKAALLTQPSQRRQALEIPGERIGARAIGDENDYGHAAADDMRWKILDGPAPRRGTFGVAVAPCGMGLLNRLHRNGGNCWNERIAP